MTIKHNWKFLPEFQLANIYRVKNIVHFTLVTFLWEMLNKIPDLSIDSTNIMLNKLTAFQYLRTLQKLQGLKAREDRFAA